MKKAILIPAILMSGCAYNSTMGVNDRFQVASTTSLFAPSVTTVVDTLNPDVTPPTFAGQSLFTQLGAVAGPVAGGYLLGNGIGKAKTNVSQGGAVSGSVSGAVSKSNSSARQNQGQVQLQGQGQTLGGHHNDGLEINN